MWSPLAKLSFCSQAALSQWCLCIWDHMSWIVDTWGKPTGRSRYPGSSSPGNRVGVELSVLVAAIIQQFLAGLILGSSWLLVYSSIGRM